MKKDIHPRYKNLKVKIGDDLFDTMSTYNGDQLLMDVDYRSHPAWTKQGYNTTLTSNKNVSSFNERFSSIFS